MKNRLKVRRAELRVTQVWVATKSGINQSRLSHIETEALDPTDAEIKTLTRVLKAKPEELFPSLASSVEASAS